LASIRANRRIQKIIQVTKTTGEHRRDRLEQLPPLRTEQVRGDELQDRAEGHRDEYGGADTEPDLRQAPAGGST
jgi:hypothetical protein